MELVMDIALQVKQPSGFYDVSCFLEKPNGGYNVEPTKLVDVFVNSDVPEWMFGKIFVMVTDLYDVAYPSIYPISIADIMDGLPEKVYVRYSSEVTVCHKTADDLINFGIKSMTETRINMLLLNVLFLHVCAREGFLLMGGRLIRRRAKDVTVAETVANVKSVSVKEVKEVKVSKVDKRTSAFISFIDLYLYSEGELRETAHRYYLGKRWVNKQLFNSVMGWGKDGNMQMNLSNLFDDHEVSFDGSIDSHVEDNEFGTFQFVYKDGVASSVYKAKAGIKQEVAKATLPKRRKISKLEGEVCDPVDVEYVDVEFAERYLAQLRNRKSKFSTTSISTAVDLIAEMEEKFFDLLISDGNGGLIVNGPVLPKYKDVWVMGKYLVSPYKKDGNKNKLHMKTLGSRYSEYETLYLEFEELKKSFFDNNAKFNELLEIGKEKIEAYKDAIGVDSFDNDFGSNVSHFGVSEEDCINDNNLMDKYVQRYVVLTVKTETGTKPLVRPFKPYKYYEKVYGKSLVSGEVKVYTAKLGMTSQNTKRSVKGEYVELPEIQGFNPLLESGVEKSEFTTSDMIDEFYSSYGGKDDFAGYEDEDSKSFVERMKEYKNENVYMTLRKGIKLEEFGSKYSATSMSKDGEVVTYGYYLEQEWAYDMSMIEIKDRNALYSMGRMNILFNKLLQKALGCDPKVHNHKDSEEYALHRKFYNDVYNDYTDFEESLTIGDIIGTEVENELCDISNDSSDGEWKLMDMYENVLVRNKLKYGKPKRKKETLDISGASIYEIGHDYEIQLEELQYLYL